MTLYSIDVGIIILAQFCCRIIIPTEAVFMRYNSVFPLVFTVSDLYLNQ